MSAKQELVAAGKDALLRDGLDAMGAMGARMLAIRVIEAVEPLIQVPAWKDGYDTAKAAYDAVLAEMRAEVAALTHDGLSPKNSQVVLKREVLEILNGGSE